MAVDDSYTKALLHMDGSDGSTTFTDESGKTWTANGNAQIDTAQSKFGGASGLFDGSGDYIDTPDHADFNVGSDNFTIDCWFKKAANNVTYCLFGQCDSAATDTTVSFVLKANQDGAGNHPYCAVYTGSTVKDITSSVAVTDGGWHHIAMVRNGNTMTLYLDGTSVGTVDITGVTVNNSANKPTIGRVGELSAQFYNGWIDEFRFSKGIARWTANFTPPTSAYAPPSSGGIGFFPFF